MNADNQKVAAIFAHADDETLGAGGTLAKHCKNKDDVCAIFLTDGVGSRDEENQAQARSKAAKKACEALGFDSIFTLNFPDNAMDSISLLSIVKSLEEILTRVQPKTIYTHHHGDLNIDHRITHQAVLTACRPMPDAFVRNIYGCEVLSSTEWNSPTPNNVFMPNHFVDINDVWKQKKSALEAYGIEMRDFPHSRSFETAEALAIYRGSQAGFKKGEAFEVIRQIKD